MEAERAADILRALADGVDPFTGEVLDARSPLQNPECVRALFAAIEALEGRSSARSNRAGRNRGLPDRAGEPWDEHEDGELMERFDTGWNIADLAKHHHRTRGAIRARLVRLGKLDNRGNA
jgi:hypothetical protein